MQPSIRHNFYEVLGWHGLEKRYSEGYSVLISKCPLFEDELLTVEYLFRVAILYIDPEWFS